MDTQATGGVDMGKLRDSIDAILNAIVQSTELAKQVEVMTRDVGQLRQDIDTTQARNVELDRMLHDTREQRDRAEHEAKQAKADLSALNYASTNLQTEVNMLRQELEGTRSQLDTRTKERDEYGLNGMAIQEALDKANAKLASIHQTMGIEFKPFEVPKPEPEVVAKVTEPWNEPPTLEPIHPTPKCRVYSGESGYDYGDAAHDRYDTDTGRWYQEI